MRDVLKIGQENIEIESNLQTLFNYESLYKKSVVEEIDNIDIINQQNVKEKKGNISEVLRLMSQVVWAVVNTANPQIKIDDLYKYDPSEIMSAYTASSNLIINSFKASPKND